MSIIRNLERALLLSSIVALSFTASAWAHSAVFSNFSVNEAKQLAQQNSKFLLIDFTASWCPPCQKMESTTWSDNAVQSWIKENAIAIQVDVDKEDKTASAFRVTGMPTLVLFTPQSGAREFGRQDGYLDASELLQWLEGAKSGKTANDLEKEMSNSGGTDVWQHWGQACQLQAAGKNAEAFEEYLWLWNNVRSEAEGMKELRIGAVPLEMRRICAVVPAAKSKVTELRAAAEKNNNRHDWILLNGILDDNASTLAWFDKAKLDATGRDTIKKNLQLLEPALFSAMRYSDAASYLYPDPMGRLSELYKQSQDMKKPRPDTEFAKDFDPFPSMVMLLYGAFIGANREADAQKIADECLRLDNSDGMKEALANMAKGMRQARTASQASIAAPANKAVPQSKATAPALQKTSATK